MTASSRSRNIVELFAVAALALLLATMAHAQSPGAKSAAATASPAAAASDPALPPGYVIGTDDVLAIMYWKDKDMSAETAVRPDGKIALPLINEITAAGLTPDQLREKITEESKKYMEDASITVVVRQINSRKVFITGEVNKPGPYPLTASTTVLQLISMAGGLREYANGKRILIMRNERGKQVGLKFNYEQVAEGRGLTQNIELKPGDTVVVP